MGNTTKVALEPRATAGAGGGEVRTPARRRAAPQQEPSSSDLPLGAQVTQALRPLTPLLAAAAFAVTAMTLVGSLLVV